MSSSQLAEDSAKQPLPYTNWASHTLRSMLYFMFELTSCFRLTLSEPSLFELRTQPRIWTYFQQFPGSASPDVSTRC